MLGQVPLMLRASVRHPDTGWQMRWGPDATHTELGFDERRCSHVRLNRVDYPLAQFSDETRQN